jgi:SAM-dependent methyltransferase
MTPSLRKIIEAIAMEIPAQKKILEIGARQGKNQEKDANMRSLFRYTAYIGTDMQSGPGVDRIANAEHLPFSDKSFSLVLCLETFEHMEKPWLAAAEIERVLADGGTVIVSTQQNYPLHKHPSDYFRFTPYGLRSLFSRKVRTMMFTASPVFGDEYKLNPETVILVGYKGKQSINLNSITRALQKLSKTEFWHKPYRHRVFDCLRFMKRAFFELRYRQKVHIMDAVKQG